MAAFLRRKRRILIDINTQKDLVFKEGRSNERVLRNIRRLFAFSRVQGVPVISFMLSQRPVVCPELKDSDATVCTQATIGHEKIRYTQLHSHKVFDSECRMDLPRNLLKTYQQVIFESETEDPLSLPRADRMLTEAKADEFIVLGMGLCDTMKHVVLALLRQKKNVLLVEDAIEQDDKKAIELGLRKLEAKGAHRIKTEEIAGESLLGKKTPAKANVHQVEEARQTAKLSYG